MIADSEENKSLHILAVDDEETNLEILEHILIKNHYKVSCMSDGAKALVMLHSEPDLYDIVLLDRMMPVMDGITVLKNLKDHPKLCNIPVIMQTAASNKEQIEEGIEAGAYYYLTKPYSSKGLLKIVEAAANDMRLSKLRRQGRIEDKHDQSENHFSIQTLQEAEILALHLAGRYPSPERVVFGITELMMNAIEHGNLGVGYDAKTQLTNDGNWLEEIERRQRLPENADKYVTVDFARDEHHITLTVEDMGEGFDWKPFLTIDPMRAIDNHGRGIAITAMQCFDTLEYMGKGNKVAAVIHLGKEENTSFQPDEEEKKQDAISSAPATKQSDW